MDWELFQTVERESDLFEYPTRLLLTGTSNSGKSHFLELLVRKHHERWFKIVLSGTPNKLLEFEETKGKTILHNDDENPIYDPLKNHDEIDIRNHPNQGILVIYDDLMRQCHASSIISDVFSKGRHKSVSIILVMQSYFPASGDKSYYPSIKNNTNVQIFFKMRNMGELSLIARRVEYDKSGQAFFINIMKNEVQKKKWIHCFISRRI